MNKNRHHKSTPAKAASSSGHGAAHDRVGLIVVADDDVDMRLYLGRCLRPLARQGTIILEAVDGAEALAFVQRGDVDLLISDVVMPRMDGLALCRAVRLDPDLRHVPILLVTGELSSHEVRSQVRDCEAIEVMGKPFNADQILARVRSILAAAPVRSHSGEEPQEDS